MVQFDRDRAVGVDQRGQMMVRLVVERDGRGLVRGQIARRPDDLLGTRENTEPKQLTYDRRRLPGTG